MIEIFVLWSCATALGKLAREKGRCGWCYQVLIVVTWFVAEFLGIVVGLWVERSLHFGEPVLKFAMGLGLAGLSAWLIFQYVGSLSSLNAPDAPSDAAPPPPSTETMPLPRDDGNPYRAPS